MYKYVSKIEWICVNPHIQKGNGRSVARQDIYKCILKAVFNLEIFVVAALAVIVKYMENK